MALCEKNAIDSAALDASLPGNDDLLWFIKPNGDVVFRTWATILNALNLAGSIIDITPPHIVSVTVVSASVVKVVLDEACVATVLGWLFGVQGGEQNPPVSVAGSGTTWYLTTTYPFSAGQTITWSYSEAGGDTKDLAGNKLASGLGQISGIATNSISATPPATTTFTARWGWMDAAPTTEAEITALQGSGTFNDQADTTADYRANTVAKYLVYAEPTAQPAKTKWYGDITNNGTIGTDLFNAPVIIGAYRVYTTQYQTYNTDTTIQFLKA